MGVGSAGQVVRSERPWDDNGSFTFPPTCLGSPSGGNPETVDARMPRNDYPDVEALPGHPVRVMVVDDHEVFRNVMRKLVTGTDGFILVGEATSGEAALTAVESLSPDLVVIDVRMPGMGGVAAAVALLERYPDRIVLLVSAQELTETPPVGPYGETIPFVRKTALRTHVLRDVWEEGHRLTGG